MKELFSYLFKESSARAKSVIAILVVAFAAGMYWARLGFTLSDHEKRISRLELAFSETPAILKEIKELIKDKK